MTGTSKHKAQQAPATVTSATVSQPPASTGTAAAATQGLQRDSRWFDLASNLGSAWAWPAVVLVICLLFKRHIRDALDRLIGFLGRLPSGGWGSAWVSSSSVTTVSGTSRTSHLPEGIEISSHASKVLATLWTHQREHFGNDAGKRWTFVISPLVPFYAEFSRGVADAMEHGLVKVNPQNFHAMLTDDGVVYCQQHSRELEGDLYVEAVAWRGGQ